MNKNKIIELIVANGRKGAEAVEKYINIDGAKIIDEDGLSFAQLCYFSDTSELLVYALDEGFNGYWLVYDELTDDIKSMVENYMEAYPCGTGFDTEDGLENEKKECPEVIIYRGNQIHKFGEDRYVAYVMDRYGDIDDYEKSTLEEAQEVIDKHIGNYNLN